MTWLITETLIILIGVSAIIAGLIDRRIWIAAGVAFLLVFGLGDYFLSSTVQVGSGDLGVEYNFAGVVDGQVAPGVSMIAPWNSVQIVNTKTQTVAFAHLAAVSNDSQDVYGDVQVNYHLAPQAVQQLYRTVGPNWYNAFIPGAVQQAFKEQTTHYTTVEIAPNRAKITDNLATTLAALLAPHSIVVDNVFLTNFDYSPQFHRAIEAKAAAQQRAAQAVQQADAAENLAVGQAQAVKTDADARAYSIRVQAAAQAGANHQLEHSLTPLLVQYQSVQKLNPNVKVMLVPANGNLLNLGSLGR